MVAYRRRLSRPPVFSPKPRSLALLEMTNSMTNPIDDKSIGHRLLLKSSPHGQHAGDVVVLGRCSYEQVQIDHDPAEQFGRGCGHTSVQDRE